MGRPCPRDGAASLKPAGSGSHSRRRAEAAALAARQLPAGRRRWNAGSYSASLRRTIGRHSCLAPAAPGGEATLSASEGRRGRRDPTGRGCRLDPEGPRWTRSRSPPGVLKRLSGILATARRWDPVRVTRTSESLGQCRVLDSLANVTPPPARMPSRATRRADTRRQAQRSWPGTRKATLKATRKATREKTRKATRKAARNLYGQRPIGRRRPCPSHAIVLRAGPGPVGPRPAAGVSSTVQCTSCSGSVCCISCESA